MLYGFNMISRLPRLRKLTLIIPEVMAARGRHDQHDSLLQALAAVRNLDTLKDLEIVNFQNPMPKTELFTEPYITVMGRIETLTIGFRLDRWIESRRRISNEHHWNLIFPQWLSPCMRSLRSLTLFFDSHWGIKPAVAMQRLKFTRLEVLEMARWTFASKWQIEWIEAHASTLRKLTLVNCPIVFCHDDPANRHNFWGTEPPDISSYNCPLRWKDIFARFGRMCKLTQFRMMLAAERTRINRDPQQYHQLPPSDAPTPSALKHHGILYDMQSTNSDLRPFVQSWWCIFRQDEEELTSSPLIFYQFMDYRGSLHYPDQLPFCRSRCDAAFVLEFRRRFGFSEEDHQEMKNLASILKERRMQITG
jgi:hypothetical protein